MPMYTFKCPKCNKVKEVLQKMDDSPPVCVDCSIVLPRYTIEMERQFTGSGGFKLKGGGWFKDGYTKLEKPK